MMFTRKAALLLTLVWGTAHAQEASGVPWRTNAPEIRLTGSARTDLVGQMHLLTAPDMQEQKDGAGETSKKSPWLAAGLSAIVPGTGEFYAESYWKSAAFFVIEVVAWTVAITYDNKGDRQTNQFQDYADAHWSVIRYAEYAESKLNPPHPPYNWFIPDRPDMAPWNQVNWSELNRMERDIGDYYSHTLPPYGDQQYYEEIGKYPQYNMGWDDANPSIPPDYSSMVANITPNFTSYAGQRGQANSYYNTASTFVTVAIVNHILSAADAAWSATQYNHRLHATVGFQRVPLEIGMADVPVLKLRYSF
jgi:hypothetical protein